MHSGSHWSESAGVPTAEEGLRAEKRMGYKMDSTASGLVIIEDIKCPKCSSETSIRISKKGPNVGHSFYVCTRYPECKGKVAVETVAEKHGIYCSRCGFNNSDQARFCQHCGESLKSTTQRTDLQQTMVTGTRARTTIAARVIAR